MTQDGRVRVGVLISGAGSNMAALIDAGRREDAAFQVVCVVSNDPRAGGLAVAGAKGVATQAIDHRPFGRDRAGHEAALDAALRTHNVQLVALAGYMRILTPWLVGRWPGRMVNIHPSLLPRHPGLDTHSRAIAACDEQAGCTVHWVTDGVDQGPIIDQARTPILPDDTPSALAQRVLALEHRLYPAALNRVCRVSGGPG